MREIGVLYVGGDDSNHAGIWTQHELIVGTFSELHKDSIVEIFPRKRNIPLSLTWIGEMGRDYRVAQLTQNRYRHSSRNLVEILPEITCKYMEQKEIYPRSLKMYLDGRLDLMDKEYIKSFFIGKRGIEEVVVGNFSKRKRKGGRGRLITPRKVPPLVYHADGIAHSLFKLSREELNETGKLIFVD
jgi:hypothetical protein